MRINEFYKYMLFLSLLSCNMSDYNEEITNGYQYNFESSDKCLNSIINPEKRIKVVFEENDNLRIINR